MKTCQRCNFEYNEDFEPSCPECIKENLFYRKNLKDENEIKLLISIRLSPEERIELDKIKKILDIKGDSTALKVCAFKGWGVLQRTFGSDFLKWLSDKERESRITFNNNNPRF